MNDVYTKRKDENWIEYHERIMVANQNDMNPKPARPTFQDWQAEARLKETNERRTP